MYCLLIFFLFVSNPDLGLCDGILDKALKGLVIGLDNAWNPNKERNCDLLLFGTANNQFLEDRQLILRNEIPLRSSPLPSWYISAWLIRQLSWCVIAVVRRDNQTNPDQINTIVGIANGVVNRNLAIIIGGEKPKTLDSQSIAFHIEYGSKENIALINLYCPNATVGYKWRSYNVWNKMEGFMTNLINPMRICPHPIKHNNVTIVRVLVQVLYLYMQVMK